MKRAGFTLIELWVVMAIIAILAAMLLPVLSKGKGQTQGIQCMNNGNQMVKAWTTYAGDNNDACVNNFGVTETDSEVAVGTFNTWCVDNMDWTTNPQNTNAGLLAKGLLGRYMGGSVGAYKCPADKYLSSAQMQAGFLARVRSYSMNGFLGLFSQDPSDSTRQGVNEFASDWPQFLKLGRISQPSTIFVFLDEHPNSINDGYFQDGDQGAPSAPTSWEGPSDLPASFHNRAGGFSFSDGHSEIHKWLVPGTLVPVSPGQIGQPTATIMPGNNYTDRIWLCGHACVK